MDFFNVTGRTPLNGQIEVFAAKNAILPMIAASILCKNDSVVLHNIPDILDVRVMIKVVERLGAEIIFDNDNNKLSINASNLKSVEAPYELVSKMRASFMVLGPLLAKYGEAKVSQPGGCAIGARPIDQHIRGFAKLGAVVTDEHGYIVARSRGKLIGGDIYFDRPSHTGTENIIMSAVLAKGETKIINAAQDPEIVDFANMLNLMGAKVSGTGTSTVTIEGVESLHGVDYTPIGDRLEAGTYLFGVMSTGGTIKVNGIKPEFLKVPILKISEMGGDFKMGKDWIRLKAPKSTKSVNIVTDPYPGFPTDLQPMVMASLCTAEGVGVIWERVFENRFIHVMEFNRLGANIRISGDRATIIGNQKLEGTTIMCSDIRAGAGLLIAAMVSNGNSKLKRVYHIDRGYQRLDERFNSLGAKIQRLSE